MIRFILPTGAADWRAVVRSAFSLWSDCHLHGGFPGNHDYESKSYKPFAGHWTHSLSVLLFNSGLLFLPLERRYFCCSQLFGCNLTGFLFSHTFLILPESLALILKRESSSCLNTIHASAQACCLLSVETEIHSEIWTTEYKTERVIRVSLVQTHPKNLTVFPHQRWYPLKSEVKKKKKKKEYCLYITL